MKRIMMMTALMTIAISVSAITFSKAQSEALFLTDKMAYELFLSEEQYEAVYEINFDYFYSVRRSDVYGIYWERRNNDLRWVLSPWQYDRYVALSYFYRPTYYNKGTWYFTIHSRYTTTGYYYAAPNAYSVYRGGNNRPSASHYQGRNFNQPRPGDQRPGGYHPGNYYNNPGGNMQPQSHPTGKPGNQGPTNGHGTNNRGNNPNSGHFGNNGQPGQPNGGQPGNPPSNNGKPGNPPSNNGHVGNNGQTGNPPSNSGQTGNSNRPRRNVGTNTNSNTNTNTNTNTNNNSNNQSGNAPSGTFGGKRTK